MGSTISKKPAEAFFRVEEAKMEAAGFSEKLACVHQIKWCPIQDESNLHNITFNFVFYNR
jgi:hypothetical protein